MPNLSGWQKSMAQKTPKTARAVRPNKGLEVAYRKELDKLVTEMSNSVQYWLEAAYKANPPRMQEAIAEDAKVGSRAKELQEFYSLRSPSARMRKPMKELADRWIKRFDDMAQTIALRFVEGGVKYTDASFKAALKDAGFTVQFKMTPIMRDAANASIQENVALIKSIPQQYLSDVEGIVMRGYTAGRDLKTISDELQQRYGVTKRRAALISRDQSNKLNATITQARRVDLGLYEAIWVHSGGGKEPRPSHVKAGRDKLKFDVRQGAYLDGEYLLPGQAINCHPGESKVNIAHGCMKLYRRWYSGELVTIIADDGVILKATPNHPILTDKGWKSAQFIDFNDYLVSGSYQGINVVDADVKNSVPTFDNFFNAAFRLFNSHTANATDSILNFHGDIADSYVDVIDITRNLPFGIESGIYEDFVEFILSFSDSISDVLTCDRSSDEFIVASLISTDRRIGGFSSLLSKLRAESFSAFNVCGASTPNFDALLDKYSSYYGSRNPVVFRQLQLAKSGDVSMCNVLIRQFLAALAFGAIGNMETIPADRLCESSRRDAETLCNNGNIGSASNAFKRVRNVFKSESNAAHVFNVETKSNWYVVNGIITHNCRCTSKTVLPF